MTQLQKDLRKMLPTRNPNSCWSWLENTTVHRFSFCIIILLLLLLNCVEFSTGQLLQVTSPVPSLGAIPYPPPAPLPQSSPNIITDDFSPLVSAHCDRGIMHVTIITQQPFWGVAHSRDHRKAPCLINGTGSTNTTLKISLLAQSGDELYCGVQRFKGERSLSLAVRPHKSLELSEDRFFYLTCHTGYKNVAGGTYRVALKLLDEAGNRVNRLVHGSPYRLRAELSPRDSITTLRMKNCFVFAKSTDHVELVDRSGCPAASGLVSAFVYNDSASGEARIPEMFKFADEAKVHFQCDALLCREGCDEPDCEGTSKAREFELDGYSQVSASTTVQIREPSDSDALTNPDIAADKPLECTEWRFPWLITLCICLAIMLLVMLLLNLFMCSSMTCRCIKTEENEKEPSDYGDYDPYRADWTAPNSLHGSRYSLENARSGAPGGRIGGPGNAHHSGYTSTDETVNSETTSGRGGGGGGQDNDSYVPDRQYIHGDPAQQRMQQNRPRRHLSNNNSSSEDDSDDDQHHRNRMNHSRPDSRANYSLASNSMRPIRPKEIDYDGGGGGYNYNTAHRY